MKKIIFITIAFVALSLSVSAQSGAGRLKGFVASSIRNGSAINATVELRAIENHSKTKTVETVETKDGYYDIEVSFGYYELTISSKGYQTYQTKVFIPSSATLEWGTLLQKSESKLDGCVSGNCDNGKGKIIYTDGYIYEGDFVNGKAEGQGVLTSTSGQVYVGQFANEKYNGKGKLTFPDGGSYEGDWVYDQQTGKGKTTYPNGSIYVGDYVNGNQEGRGRYTFKNGNYYTGEWKNNLKNGYGKEYIKATKTTREGTWKDDVFVGAGVQGSKTDKCVSGNCNNGKGKLIYADGNIYEGDFVKGKKEGQGTFTVTETGQVYIGQFTNERYNGRGKMTFSDGESYEGDWVYDQKTGKGKTMYSNGDIYEGDFVDSKKDGRGTYTFRNGNYYTGEWKNNLKNGYGKEYTKATATTREGIWKDDFYVGKQ